MSGTKAGEFFVNLGVKGNEKTQSDINKTKDSFGDLKSVSTEAKLAILGVLYGVERMVSTYGVLGNQLKNFSVTSGIATNTLLKYENAAQKAGAANGELQSTFDNLQKMMYGIQTGQLNAPWLQVITGTLQGQGVKFTPEEMQNTAMAWMMHPELMFQRLSEFAQNKLLKPAQTTNILRELGLSDNLIAGMMRGFFNQQALNAGQNQIISGDTINKLTELNKKWVDLTLTMKNFFAMLSGHGVVRNFVDELNSAANGLVRFMEWSNHIKGLGKPMDVDAEIEKKLGMRDKQGHLIEHHRGQKFLNQITNKFSIVIHATGKEAKEIGQEVKKTVHEVFKEIPDHYSAKAAN